MTETYQLQLLNVNCASCVSKIEAAIKGMDPTVDFQISFAERLININGKQPSDKIIATLATIGYQAVLYQQENEQALVQQQLRVLRHRATVAGVFGACLMFLSMSTVSPSLQSNWGQLIWFVIAIGTLLVMGFAGKDIYMRAFKSICNRHATMDTLISIGVSAAWFFSLVITLIPSAFPKSNQHLYYEASLLILAFVNIGAALEIKARGKTSEAINRLIGLKPDSATRVLANGSEEKIKVADIGIGDHLRVKPGEKLPVDGVIVEGHSSIDESMLTGESMPISKKEGDKVYCGTLNKMGAFIFTVTQSGQDTALSKIIALVKQAQATKPPISKLTDQVSAYFVPFVLLFALLTAFVWSTLGYGINVIFLTSMSVLVIACPCALGLAAPISVIIGMGKAAEKGVLIRNGEALQKASQLNAILLDKTGTITEGQPSIVDISIADKIDKHWILQLAGSIEQSSEHPLAQAIVNEVKKEKIKLLPIKNFKAMIGFGVSAIIDGKTVFLGTKKFMQANGISDQNLDEAAQEFSLKGQTPVYIAVDTKVAAILAIADPIKPSSIEAISKMKQLGLDVFMVTGDNSRTASTIAEQVGIINVVSEALPDDKTQKVKKLQLENKVVAMVGDGINDSPALSQADVGFAIGGGTDVAIESADITLMNNSLQSVLDAIFVSQATMRNIKQNLVAAFLYNSLGIPIAAGILYPIFAIFLNPAFAGLAMAASSITVVMNANRLRHLIK
jgi:Cu+-exporting ATPase